jgi:hypothetical protein
MGCICSSHGFQTAENEKTLIEMMEEVNKKYAHDFEALSKQQDYPITQLNHKREFLNYANENVILLKVKNVPNDHFYKLKIFVENFYKGYSSESTFEMKNGHKELNDFILALESK